MTGTAATERAIWEAVETSGLDGLVDIDGNRVRFGDGALGAESLDALTGELRGLGYRVLGDEVGRGCTRVLTVGPAPTHETPGPVMEFDASTVETITIDTEQPGATGAILAALGHAGFPAPGTGGTRIRSGFGDIVEIAFTDFTEGRSALFGDKLAELGYEITTTGRGGTAGRDAIAIQIAAIGGNALLTAAQRENHRLHADLTRAIGERDDATKERDDARAEIVAADQAFTALREENDRLHVELARLQLADATPPGTGSEHRQLVIAATHIVLDELAERDDAEQGAHHGL